MKIKNLSLNKPKTTPKKRKLRGNALVNAYDEKVAEVISLKNDISVREAMILDNRKSYEKDLTEIKATFESKLQSKEARIAELMECKWTSNDMKWTIRWVVGVVVFISLFEIFILKVIL